MIRTETEAQVRESIKDKARGNKFKLLAVVLVAFSIFQCLTNFGLTFGVVFLAKDTAEQDNSLVGRNGQLIGVGEKMTSLPMIAAPALPLDALSAIKSIRATYKSGGRGVNASLSVVEVQKLSDTVAVFSTQTPANPWWLRTAQR